MRRLVLLALRTAKENIGTPIAEDVVDVGRVTVRVRFIFVQIGPLTGGVRVDIKNHVLVGGLLPVLACLSSRSHFESGRLAGVFAAKRNLCRLRRKATLPIHRRGKISDGDVVTGALVEQPPVSVSVSLPLKVEAPLITVNRAVVGEPTTQVYIVRNLNKARTFYVVAAALVRV